MSTATSSASGRCPVCGGTELYRTKLASELRPIGKSVFITEHILGVDLVVCASCGRAEHFCAAESIEYLRKLAADGKYVERYGG